MILKFFVGFYVFVFFVLYIGSFWLLWNERCIGRLWVIGRINCIDYNKYFRVSFVIIM